MTFSLAGRCADSGMVGAVITTSSPCVGARCLWVRSNSGVVLTQNVTNPALGPLGLDRMASGGNAKETLAYLVDVEPHPAYRQLALLDHDGNSAHYSGEQTLGINAVASGSNCIAAGNLLDNRSVPGSMVNAFETSQGHLADRLIKGVEAGLAAGGEAGPVHSAALLICHTQLWPIVDLRVDWHEEPVTQLRAVWNVYNPQMADYILRADNPVAAPSYGVPGDD